MRKGYCITSEESLDNFVGIRFHDGVPEVIFPHGFNIADDEKERRKDVFRLLSILQRFTDHKEGDESVDQDDTVSNLPITSYQYIIQDFLTHGYYVEREVRYVEGTKGKISWKRTIQQEQPLLDDGNVVYLRFQLKTSQINSDNLLTKIHHYCVYQSFFKFGWLYLTSEYLPPEPSYKADTKLFLYTLRKAFNSTFSDAKKKLFQSMINIILDVNDEVSVKDISIGVNKFEGVWERLTDYVFGEPNKEKYFPHATWYTIQNGKINKSSALEPDIIMKYHGNIYVLDAKYYQYGITYYAGDLPQTSSIQKQITYGKHIVEHKKELDVVPTEDVFNAFIMPFEAPDGEKYKFVSVGTADWERYNQDTLNYAFVLGILLDTKWLISRYTQHNQIEIERLSDLIEKSLVEFRKQISMDVTPKPKHFIYNSAKPELQMVAESEVEYDNKKD